MCINYIIATYAGKYNRENKALVLQKQLEQLYEILKRKRDLGAENLISRITIVCPTPKHPPYENYYKPHFWLEKFQELSIPLTYIKYIGANIDHSYDQWLEGFLESPRCEYNIFIEDDYCVFENDNFDTELVALYKTKFPKGIGYLATWAAKHMEPKLHLAISNGIVSSKTLESLGNPLIEYYKCCKYYSCPQLKFSELFIRNSIPVADFSDRYKLPFWDSKERKLEDYSKEGVVATCFVPVQFIGVSTDSETRKEIS